MPKKKAIQDGTQSLYAIEQRDLADVQWKVATCISTGSPYSYKAVYSDRETAQKVMKEWLNFKYIGREFLIRCRQQYRIRPIYLLPENGKGFGVSRPHYVGSVEERKRIKAMKVKK